tara:strand:+ start:104 stop:850 length:747 start_codon:yes stop_codon:yes gene_type:complete
MNNLELEHIKHDVKVGDKCCNKTANITEDTLFTIDGEPVGFYIKSVSGKMKQLLEISNKEFRGDNVPKSVMKRASGVEQYSTIIGSIPASPMQRRPYPSISSVHRKKKARNFIKAMMLLCRESETLIKKHLPNIYKKQKQVMNENTAKRWRFSDLYTSSISNYNISANYHRDTGNLKDTVNVIFSKRFDSEGGYLDVPDYGLTIECSDNSMICYPAWKSIHGVSPIIPHSEGGYRNSLIFYPLKGFDK